MTNQKYYYIQTIEREYVRQKLYTYTTTKNIDYALTSTNKNILIDIAEDLNLKGYTIEEYI